MDSAQVTARLDDLIAQAPGRVSLAVRSRDGFRFHGLPGVREAILGGAVGVLLNPCVRPAPQALHGTGPGTAVAS